MGLCLLLSAENPCPAPILVGFSQRNFPSAPKGSFRGPQNPARSASYPGLKASMRIPTAQFLQHCPVKGLHSIELKAHTNSFF